MRWAGRPQVPRLEARTRWSVTIRPKGPAGVSVYQVHPARWQSNLVNAAKMGRVGTDIADSAGEEQDALMRYDDDV